MSKDWKTVAIGRHLVDVPADAELIPQWVFDEDRLYPLPVKNAVELQRAVTTREAELRSGRREDEGSMLIEVIRLANGSTALVSWASPSSKNFRFDTYFRVGSKALYYPSPLVGRDRKDAALQTVQEMSERWREVEPGKIAEGVGFVVGDMQLVDKLFNRESWSLYITLAGKPDVSLEVSAFALYKVGETLRQRAGGVVAGMLGLGLGLVRLRNRERPVGPIWAEEILVAGTQRGKRGYGFKWEAPGKAHSLAEPQINVELEVSESAYTTNAESFASDAEALALWDRLVESIRLRPGAV